MAARITPRIKTSKDDLYEYLRDYGPTSATPLAEFEPFAWAEAILDFAHDHGFETVRVALSRLRAETLGKATNDSLHLALDIPDHDSNDPRHEEAADSMMPTGPLPPAFESTLGTAAKDRIALRALEQGHTIPGADWYTLSRAGLVESEGERWTSVGHATEGKLTAQGKARLEELEELDH